MSHVRYHRAVEVGAANFLAAHGLEEGPAVRKRSERPAEGARPPAGGRRAPRVRTPSPSYLVDSTFFSKGQN